MKPDFGKNCLSPSQAAEPRKDRLHWRGSSTFFQSWVWAGRVEGLLGQQQREDSSGDQVGGASDSIHCVILTRGSFVGTGAEGAGFRIFKEKLET